MPNQKPNNEPIASFIPQTDLPPLPNNDQPPTITSNSQPVLKNPGKKGRIIATILGIFLLLAGIGAGIFLIRQKQLFQQKASAPSGCLCPVPNPNNIPCVTPTYGTSYVDLQTQAGCNYCGWNWSGGTCCPGGGDSCSPIGAIRCVNTPQVQECHEYGPACSNGAWQPIAYYNTTEELCADVRCQNETFCGGFTPGPSFTPTGTGTPVPTSTPTGTATATPTGTATATPTSTPTGSASPTPTGSGSPTPGTTSTPTGTVSPTPTTNPSSTPNSCNGTCGSDANCLSPYYVCHGGFCRDRSCPDRTDCTCQRGGSNPTPTQASLPVSGTNWPSLLGTGVSVLVILGAIMLFAI